MSDCAYYLSGNEHIFIATIHQDTIMFYLSKFNENIVKFIS